MDWAHRFIDTITVAPRAGMNDGDVTYGAQTTVKCRLEEYTDIVKQMGGQERMSTHRIATAQFLPEGTRIWLPGTDPANGFETIEILKTSRARMLNGSYTLYIYTCGR